MFHLKRNVAAGERAARLVLAVIAAGAAWIFATGAVAWAGWLIAATLASTSLIGFCPACAMVGRRPLGE